MTSIVVGPPGWSDGSMALLASIVESSEDAILSKSLAGVITSWNPAAERMFGYSAGEIVGQHISVLVHPDRSDELPEILARIQAGDRVEHYETVRVRKDGSEVAVSLTVSAMRDAAGVVVGASSISRDITERLQAEAQSRAATQYARSLIEASLDPLVTISPEGKITDVNEATMKVTGVGRDELIGADFSDYFTEPDMARQGYQQVFAEGSVTDYPLTIRHTDGQQTDVLYNASVYKDAAGNVLGVFAAARDVTAQKQASQYARSLIEASLDPLVTISPEGKITDVNEATMKVTGVGRDELIGADFSDYFTEPERARQGYQQVFAEGSVTDYPLTIRHTDGQQTDVLYNASVYKDTAGNALGVFAAARDVTAQKQAEAKFQGLLESAPDAIVVVDSDGLIRLVNRQTETLFGYERAEILGEPIEVLMPDKIRGRHPGLRGSYYADPQTRTMGAGLELTARRRDGSEFPVDVALSPLQTEEGVLVSASVRDVTERKRAQAEIAEQQAKELERLAELERFQSLTVGRELKMIELKKEIVELRKLELPDAVPFS